MISKNKNIFIKLNFFRDKVADFRIEPTVAGAAARGHGDQRGVEHPRGHVDAGGQKLLTQGDRQLGESPYFVHS